MITSDKIKTFEFIDPCLCNAWVATAIIGAGAIGAAATAYSANKAAGAQTNAAMTAANTSLGMYNTTRGDLSPFRAVGNNAADILGKNIDDWSKGTYTPFQAPDVVNDVNAPGYDFTKEQGLKAVQNSAAARGLGTSGAALKGAATFATGLANSTYGDVFTRALQGYQTNFNTQQTAQTNAYTRLKGLIDTGENASAQTGTAGTAAANTAAGATIGAGNAQAAAANATGGAVSNVANTVGGVATAKSMGLYGGSFMPVQPYQYNNPYGGVSNPTYG